MSMPRLPTTKNQIAPVSNCLEKNMMLPTKNSKLPVSPMSKWIHGNSRRNEPNQRLEGCGRGVCGAAVVFAHRDILLSERPSRRT